MILDTFHWIRINIPQYIVGAKREIGQNNDLPASVWFHDQTSLLKLSENLERLFPTSFEFSRRVFTKCKQILERMQMTLTKCLPYDLNASIFAPILDVLGDFMSLKTICSWRKQADLAPKLGTRRLTFFVSNIVFVCHTPVKLPW